MAGHADSFFSPFLNSSPRFSSECYDFTATLPPEIWLEIFADASYIPGAFCIDSSRTIEAFSEDVNGVVLHGLYSETLATKLALTRVCWSWRALALPRLFEYILIGSGAHAVKIAQALHTIQVSFGDKQLGKWIKRIEISTSDTYWDDESFSAVFGILNAAPNLEVFSNLFCSVPKNVVALNVLSDPRFVIKLASLCNHGLLRRLELYVGCSTILRRLLKDMQHLRVLVLGCVAIGDGYSIPIDLPELRILVCGDYLDISDYQVIRSSSIHSLIPRCDYSMDSRWNKASGPNISLLRHLRMRCKDTLLKDGFLSSFPHLRCLTVDFTRNLCSAASGLLEHSCIESIILTNVAFSRILVDKGIEDIGAHSRGMCIFLTGLANRRKLPRLKRIGLLIPHSYLSILVPHPPSAECPAIGNSEFWTSWLLRCARSDIAVEASVGPQAHFADSWRPFSVDDLPCICSARTSDYTRLSYDLDGNIEL